MYILPKQAMTSSPDENICYRIAGRTYATKSVIKLYDSPQALIR